MTRSIAWLGVGALVGALFVYGAQVMVESGRAGDSDGRSKPGADTAHLSSANPSRAIRQARDGLPRSPADGPALEATARLAELPRPEPAWSSEADPRGRYASRGDAGSGSAGPVDQVLARAEAAFARGQTQQGTQLLRGVFHQAKGRPDVDLTAEALKLLDRDDDPRARIEYIRYLQRRGRGGEAFDAQLARAGVLAASTEEEALERAWEEITVAYESAVDARDRGKVVALLAPFVDRLVLSGRFSPLLKAHTVVPGDTLWTIATRYDTTVDAIRRLNRELKSDNIQPRTRLLVLPGTVRIFVDKSDFRLWMTVNEKILFERPVGLGRDNRTPPGIFSVRVKQKNPTWYPPGESPIPSGDPRNILGTRWLGFQDTGKHFGLGIHGTDDPSDIGRESSSGCVRLLKEDMELVYDFVPRGTVVTITE